MKLRKPILNLKPLLIALIAFGVLVGAPAIQSVSNVPVHVSQEAYAKAKKQAAKVKSVIDGDTIRLTNGQTVRLIGIDTPEKGDPYYEGGFRKVKRVPGRLFRDPGDGPRGRGA